ncbi:MAG: class I SAM-dependent methyltransferase [Myxococcota bacterium]|nr:class I SAM-dependent methyltransferase [Myxococcota bacterium]
MGLLCSMVVHVLEAASLRAYLWVLGLPEPIPPSLTSEQRRLIRTRLRSLVPYVPVKDPTSWPRRVLSHIRGLYRVWRDIPAMQRRRLAKNDTDFSPEVAAELHRFPDYYCKNFHYQTNGYFTLESARLYDMQYELIFLGVGQRIRLVAATQLRRFLPAGKPYAMMEVGAGSGNLGTIMQSLYPGTEVLLTDRSVPYLHRALEKYPHMNIRAEPTFVKRLDFVPDCHLDVVMSGFLFHEIPHQVIPKAMAEMGRVLRPGGFAFILDSSQDHDGEENHFALDQFEGTFHEPYYPEFRASSLESLLADAGMVVVYQQLHFFSKVVIAQKC